MIKQVIGRTDKVDFPKLGLQDIDVKIDTGAYTSSIHCHRVTEEDGCLVCSFFDEKHPLYTGEVQKFDSYDTAVVRSSNGEKQSRYEVKSTIKLFDKVFKISLTLTSRKDMRFPVLLGRKFLTKKYIVDTELTNVSYNLKRNKAQDTIS